MKDSSISRFLDFNGNRIEVLLTDGTWHVALRPILEALNVDAEWHLRGLKTDDILSQHLCEHTGVAADGKLRKMLCLPERYIYGWLFSIRSESPELREYKLVCYDALYNHFHNAMTGRFTAITERTDTDAQITALQERLDQKLLDTEEYQQIQALKARKKELFKKLKELDEELVTGQLTLPLG